MGVVPVKQLFENKPQGDQARRLSQMDVADHFKKRSHSNVLYGTFTNEKLRPRHEEGDSSPYNDYK